MLYGIYQFVNRTSTRKRECCLKPYTSISPTHGCRGWLRIELPPRSTRYRYCMRTVSVASVLYICPHPPLSVNIRSRIVKNTPIAPLYANASDGFRRASEISEGTVLYAYCVLAILVYACPHPPCLRRHPQPNFKSESMFTLFGGDSAEAA